MSNMMSKAKKDYLCHKIVICDSSWELFHLSGQMKGKFGDTMLPSNIPLSLFLINVMNSLPIRLNR